MTYVIDEPRVGSKVAGPNRRLRAGSVHPTPDEPAFAAAEQSDITAARQRIESGPAFADSATMGEVHTGDRRADLPDDSGQGLALFLIFISAVLIVTSAVALLALVDSWWMLGVVFVVDIMITAVVTLTIYRVLAGHATRHHHGASPDARFDRQPTTHPDRPTAPGYLDRQPLPAVALNGASGSHPSEPASLTEGTPLRPRVLMITDERLAQANEVPKPIRPLVDRAQVYVVAPTLTTRLQSLTGDVDGARALAKERLRTVFDHMHADGLEPRGTVGDEDQVAAIADALANFDADLMVLRLHADGSEHENWREHRLLKRVSSRFDVPTIAFFFDADGHVVGREEGQGRDGGASSPRRAPNPTLRVAS